MKNLLPSQEQKRIRQMYLLRLAAVIVFVVSMGMLLAAFFLVPPYILATTKIAQLEQQLTVLVEQEAAGGGVDARILLEETKANMRFAEHLRTQPVVTEEVAMIRNVQPAGIAMLSFDYTEETELLRVVIKGVAATRASLIAFKEALEGLERAQVVDLPLRDLTRGEDIQYTLTIELSKP